MARGMSEIELKALKKGQKLKLTTNADHGDWKTAIVRPGKWPTLEAGTICTYVRQFNNLYGHYLTVEVAHRKEQYDIESWKFEKVK